MKFATTLFRPAAFIAGYAVLLWHFIEVITHRSESLQILQFYSYSYFAWVVFYSLFWLIWTVITILALFRWEWLDKQISHLAQDRRLSAGAWFGLPLVWFAMLAWVTVVGLQASTTTPHSGAVPLVLTAGLVLVVLGTIFRYSSHSDTPLTTSQLFNQRLTTPADEWLASVASAIASRNLSRLVALLIITVVVAILCGPALFNPGQLIGGGDIRGLYYLVETYAASTLKSGELPFWNPYVFSGFPLLARPDSMFFYPPQFILRYFLPVNLAIAWGIALHLWVAGIGMYWLCRHFSLKSWIALVCAIAFILGGGFTTRIFGGHIWKVYALAWMPIVWLCLDYALDNDSWLAVFGGAGVLALIILSGHPTFPGYILLFLGLYWLYHAAFLWHQKKPVRVILRSGAKFLTLCVLGVGLACIQLVPSIIFASQASLASGYGFDEANFGALLPAHLWMIFLPDAYEQPKEPIWELIPYLGVLLPLAAPWAFAESRNQRKAFFLGFIALLSLALAFGHELRIYSLLYYVFPPFKILRIPARALVLWTPAVIILGGIGLQVLSERLPKPGWVALNARFYRTLSVVVLGLLVGYIEARLSGITLPFSNLLSTLMVVAVAAFIFLMLQLSLGNASPVTNSAFALLALAGIVLGMISLPLLIPTDAAPGVVLLGFIKLAALLAAGSLLLPLLYQSQQSSLISVLFVFVVLIDVYTFGAKYVQTLALPFKDPEEVRALDVIPGPPEAHVMGGDVLNGSNALMSLNISSIDGYYSGTLTDYARYLRGVSGNPPLDTVVLLSNNAFPQLDRRALDFLNVTHIFSRQPLVEPGYQLVAEAPDYLIYENLNAMPRAFWVHNIEVASDAATALQTVLAPDFDYHTTVVLDHALPVDNQAVASAIVNITGFHESTGGLTVEITALQPGFLVTSEPYYNERRAWLDGVEVPLLKANVAFSAVAVPAGTHTLQFGFSPQSLYTGIAISIASLLVCIISSVVIVLRRQRNLSPLN